MLWLDHETTQSCQCVRGIVTGEGHSMGGERRFFKKDERLGKTKNRREAARTVKTVAVLLGRSSLGEGRE